MTPTPALTWVNTLRAFPLDSGAWPSKNLLYDGLYSSLLRAMTSPLEAHIMIQRHPHLVLVHDDTRAHPPWVPVDRALHLTDIENLMGGPTGGFHVLAETRERYAALAAIQPKDHVITACNPRLAVMAAAAWFPGRLLTRPGRDGADRALLEATDADDIARRYYRVVIGSGDGAFASLAEQLRTRGLQVWVIARPGTLSRSLAHAANIVGLLHPAPGSTAEHHEATGPDAA